MSSSETFTFKGAAGLSLHARVWRSPKPRYCLVGIHGYTEHSGCYAHFAEFLNSLDVDVYWMDLPGHGLSEGARSNISDFDDYIESIENFFKVVEERSQVKPDFLFAHSLGGLCSIRFLETSKRAKSLQRVALSSPLLGLSETAFHGLGHVLQSPWGLGALEAITTLLPNLTLPNEGDLGGSVLTHDPEMMKRRKKDKLMKSVVTTHWTREFLRARRQAFKEIHKIKVPLAIFQAGDDFVVSRKASEIFFEKLKSKDKKFVIYDGFYHEILNEIGREQVMKDIVAWFQFENVLSSVQGSS